MSQILIFCSINDPNLGQNVENIMLLLTQYPHTQCQHPQNNLLIWSKRIYISKECNPSIRKPTPSWILHMISVSDDNVA